MCAHPTLFACKFVGNRGLMLESGTHNRKVASSSLGLAEIVGGGSECTVLSLHLQYHDEVPLSKAPNPQLLPRGRRINGCPLLRVWVHCCVCALGWVNVEHEFRVWVTILGCMSLSLHFTKPFMHMPTMR